MARELKVFFALLFFSLLILLFDLLGFLRPAKSFGQELFLPAKKAIYQSWQKVIKVKEPDKEVAALKEKIAEQERKLATRNTQLTNCQTENAAARRLLGAPLPSDWQFLPAQAAGLVNGELVIDKGKKDGVVEGQAVISEEVLVGKVVWAGERMAKVRLPTNKESKILVKIISGQEAGGEVKARGLLVGNGSGMRLTKVLQEENLAVEDLAVTADYPPNLLIGRIEKIVKKETELYQEAEVEPGVDYQKIEMVFLIR
jgi:rod shape-determining protein MreC